MIEVDGVLNLFWAGTNMIKNFLLNKSRTLLGILTVSLCCLILAILIYSRYDFIPYLPINYELQPGQSLNVDFVNQLGGGIDSGQTKPLIVKENLVYVGLGPRLVVLDISDPTKIKKQGQSEIIPGKIGEIVLVGNYIYIAPGVYGNSKGEGKLQIVDVSDETHPKYLGAYSPQDKVVSSVYAFGGFLYITAKDITKDIKRSYQRDFYILDISIPNQPRELGHLILNAGIFDVAVSGSYAYVATREPGINQPGLRVLDVADPHKPKEVNSLYPSGVGYHVVANGDHLYFWGSTKNMSYGFHILDISIPHSPIETAIQDIGYADFLASNQDVAYFLDEFEHVLKYVDISNPGPLRELIRQKYPASAVSIQGKLVFVMDANRLTLFNIADPLNPIEIGGYTVFNPDDVLGMLNFDGKNGAVSVNDVVEILDFENPEAPTVANFYSVPNLTAIEKVQGNICYLRIHPSQVEALDISEPATPRIIWQNKGYEGKVFVNKNMIYVFGMNDQIYTFDMSNPSGSPVVSHQTKLNWSDWSFFDYAFSDKYLYVLNGRDIHVLDISNPENIIEVGLYKFSSNQSGYNKIVIIDHLAFLDNSLFNGTDPATLTIMDLSAPSKPTVITSYHWGDYSTIGGVSKEKVFIGDDSGLHVVDFSNPRNPQEIGYYGLRDGISSLQLGVDNLIYALSNSDGLYVLRDLYQ